MINLSSLFNRSLKTLPIVAASLFSRGVPFLVIPVLTSYLTPSEYGYLAYIATIVAIAAIFSGLQPHLFLIVKWGVLDRDEKAEFTTLSILSSALLGVIVCGLILVVVRPLMSIEISFFTVIMISILGVLRSVFLIFDAILQSEKKLMQLSGLLVLQTIIHYSLAVYLLEYCFQSWHGKFYAEFSAVAIICVITVFSMRNIGNYSLNFKFSQITRLFKYSFPLSFHVLSIVVMGGIDRIMIVEMIGLESAGVYAVAYVFGSIIGIFHNALLKVWNPAFYKLLKNVTDPWKLSIVSATYAYIFFSIVVLVVFVYFAPVLYSHMVPIEYVSGGPIIGIIALGYTVEAVRKLFVAYLFAKDKVKLIAAISFFAALLNIILNYYLIPVYGAHGAAWATVLTYMVITILTVGISTRFYSMPWGSYSKIRGRISEFVS